MCSRINVLKVPQALESRSPSHQSLWHVDFPVDPLQGCSSLSVVEFNGFQVSMRQKNKSANPAFIQ